MKLIEINLQPSDRQLRQFGVVCAGVALIAALTWGRGNSATIAAFLMVGVAIATIGWFRPRVLRPIFILLTIAAAPIGMVIGELVTLLVYFAVFLPIGLAFRLMGRDALLLQREPDAKTYWQPKKPPRGAASYYRQS